MGPHKTLAVLLFVGSVWACGSTAEHSNDGPEISREQQAALQQASGLLGCNSLHSSDSQVTEATPYTLDSCNSFYCDYRVSESVVSGDSSCGVAALLVCDEECTSGSPCTTTCSPEAVSDLQIDGQLFVPRSCRSGDDENQDYYGVDLDDGTTTLRFAQASDLTQSVLISADGNGAPNAFVGCARFELSRTPLPGTTPFSSAGDVFGTATLQCSGGGHTISGTVSFGCAYPQTVSSAGQACDDADSASSD
jgi:hypothetical protein